MTTIVLVRHGETDYNREKRMQGQTDVKLNENGLLQAELVGKRLRNEHFDAIYSSDLSRTALTAQAIAGDRKIHYTAALREWALGDWQNMLVSECREKDPDLYRQCLKTDSAIPVPGGESGRQLADRAMAFLQSAIRENPDKKILVVTHGGTLRAIFQRTIGLGELAREPETGNTSVNIIQAYEDGTFRLTLWNDTSHLSGKAQAEFNL